MRGHSKDQMRYEGGAFLEWVRGRLSIQPKFLKAKRNQLQQRRSCSGSDEELEASTLNHDHGHWTQSRHWGGVGKFMADKVDPNYSKSDLCSSNPVAAVLLLTTLWVCFYFGSLVGGDLHTVIHQLGHIVACFFFAMACFLAAIYTVMFSPTIPRRVKIVLLVIIIASWNLIFLYDHGGSLRHHGAYNMLVFVVFVVPAIVIAGLEYGLWHMVGWRKLLAMHLPFFIIGAIATTIALHNASKVWDQGFRGEHILPLRTVCIPVDRGLPWVDILPVGAQNFWTGKLTCGNLHSKTNVLGFHVNFSMEGALSISCNVAKSRTYTPLPSTLDWPKTDKLIEETFEGVLQRPFNKLVMDKVREVGEVPYEVFQPILLPTGIEAVIVRCGAVEKLVTHVRRNAKALSRTSPISSIVNTTNLKLDVVLLFLDATSRRGFHRCLQQTVSALEEVDGRGLTRLYQFFRYNVLSFCTELNSRAMFQGMSIERDDWISPVWEDFGKSGWVTMYSADTCQDLNAAYMNRKSKEDRQCFDHELVSPFCHSDFFAEGSNPFGNFKGPYSITARCLKGQHVHEHELHYLELFQAAYPDRAKFSLAWFLEGHEGTTEVLRYLDKGLTAYVRKLSDQAWNRTALIIVADHGLHMGLNFGLSQNGAVEHKNPMLAIMLPPWFTERENRHELMTKNQQRLVTGLDLYTTLQALRLVGWSKDMRPWVDEAEKYRLKSGIDLLHKEVPETRSCKDAAIPDEWCQCL